MQEHDGDINKAAPRNVAVALACVVFVGAMVGAAYAAVPLYQLFCQITGYGGTTQRAEAPSGTVVDVPVTVRFDANVGRKLPWAFAPDQRQITLKLGEMQTVFYKARNTADVPTTASATFNVTPPQAGAYFSKIACFCFTEQTLQPGEELEMGVTFFVDPAMLDDVDAASIRTITLSYTFYPVAGTMAPLAAVTGSETAKPL